MAARARVSWRGRALGPSAGAVGLATAALVGFAGVAAAAPVTDVVDGSGTSGTLESGVRWESTAELSGGQATLTQGQEATVAFSEPVEFELTIWSLQQNAAGQECVFVSDGLEPVSVSARHRWDPGTRQLCGVENVSGAASVFEGSAVEQVTVTATGSNATHARLLGDFRVTVERDAAELVDDAAATVTGAGTTIDVLANDVLPEGSSLPTVDAASAHGGAVTVTPEGLVVYTPPAGFVGTDSFTYQVVGPDRVARSATVTVTVTEDESSIPLVAPLGALAAGVGALSFVAVRRRARR